MTATSNKPADYKHIVAWGQKLRSFAYYIAAQQEAAFAVGAPLNAIYEKHASDGSGATGVWVTVDECHPDVRDEVNAAVEAMNARAKARADTFEVLRVDQDAAGFKPVIAIIGTTGSGERFTRSEVTPGVGFGDQDAAQAAGARAIAAVVATGRFPNMCEPF